MKKNFSQSKCNGKENMKNEKNNKKIKIICYKHLNKNDFGEPFYFNKDEFKKHKSLTQKKNGLFNFVEADDKNKNLKIFDGEKFNSFRNKNNINTNNNNPNNYYINRKFATIIFNHVHKLNMTCVKNCKKSVINKFYFCTKINIHKKKKKKSNNKHKSLDRDSLINKNSFEKLYLQRLKLKQSSSISNLKQENKKDKIESYKDKSKSKNESLNHSENNNEKLYPNFSAIYNKKNISQIKKKVSFGIQSYLSQKQRTNDKFNQILEKKRNISPINKGVRKSEPKNQGKKEILKNPLNNKRFRNKDDDIFLPKLKDIDKSNYNTKYNESKVKSNQALKSQELKLNYRKNFSFHNDNNNSNDNIDKYKTIKNDNSFKNRNQKSIIKNFPSFNIMNFNHKKAENNSIKFVHYLNDSLCSICHPISSKSNINKQNTTQMTKSSLNPKINLENSFFNQNKNELRKNNSLKNLSSKNDYKRIIRNKIFNISQKETEPIIFEKPIKPRYNEIMLRKYESQFLAVKEYFK